MIERGGFLAILVGAAVVAASEPCLAIGVRQERWWLLGLGVGGYQFSTVAWICYLRTGGIAVGAAWWGGAVLVASALAGYVMGERPSRVEGCSVALVLVGLLLPALAAKVVP